ncbi:MAG: hypothetical protein H5T66_08720 [Chloroflexi bacterium]|nr:hypothetical protein [Chloroflexota bacterium]
MYDVRGRLGRWRLALWVGAAVLGGLVIGLLLGWLVWPVRWVNTDPCDLRPEHQKTYVLMVADSLAVNGDAHLAGERLYELTDKDTDWQDIAALVAATAAEQEAVGDAAAALRLRRLAEIVQLPPPPAPVVKKAWPGKPYLLWGLGTFLVLAGLGTILWLVMRTSRRAIAPARPAPSPAQSLLTSRRPAEKRKGAWYAVWERLPRRRRAAPEREPEAPLTSIEPEVAPLGTYDMTAVGEEEEEEHLDFEEADEEEEEEGEEILLDETVVPLQGSTPEEEPRTTQPLKSLTKARLGQAWSEFSTEYHLGDDDFYYAFTIESPEREFVGQCGVVVSDLLSGELPQRVDAFEVWLFETQGNRTVMSVLASPFAYHDEARFARLSRRGEVVMAQPGTTLTLEGDHLRLTVTVTDCVYAPFRQAQDAAFSQLALTMRVEPIASDKGEETRPT